MGTVLFGIFYACDDMQKYTKQNRPHWYKNHPLVVCLSTNLYSLGNRNKHLAYSEIYERKILCLNTTIFEILESISFRKEYLIYINIKLYLSIKKNLFT